MTNEERLTKCVIKDIMPCGCGGETYIEIECGNSYSFVVQDPQSTHHPPYTIGMTVYGKLTGYCEIQRTREKIKKINYSEGIDKKKYPNDSIGQVVEVFEDDDVVVDLGDIYVYAYDRMKNKAEIGEYVIVSTISQLSIRSLILENQEYCENIEIKKCPREISTTLTEAKILKISQVIKCQYSKPFNEQKDHVLAKIIYCPWTHWKLSDKKQKEITELKHNLPFLNRYEITGEIISLKENEREKNILEAIIDCGFYVHTTLDKTIQSNLRTIKAGDFVSYEHPDYKKIKIGDYISFEEGNFEAWDITTID